MPIRPEPTAFPARLPLPRPMQGGPIRLPRSAAALAGSFAASCVLLAAVAACGKSGNGSEAVGETAAAPRRSGDVWEADQLQDRAAAPGVFTAYVYGLHTFVLDGDTVFAGTTRLAAERSGDARLLTVADGTRAKLERAGEGLRLQFTPGATVSLRKKAAP